MATHKKAATGFTHLQAREVLAQAYKNLFHREPTDGELDFGLATANFETGYGRAGGQFATWAQQGKYNWGAIETGNPGDNDPQLNKFKAAGLHPTKGKGKDAGATRYFYLFPNDVEAATAFLMSWGRKDTLAAAASGSVSGVAQSMRNHGYYEGFWVPPGNPDHRPMPPFKEAPSIEAANANNVRDYAGALHNQVKTVTGKTPVDNNPSPAAAAGKTGTLETFLNGITDWIASLFGIKTASENSYCITVLGADQDTKTEYLRILQSVLSEELGISSSIHSEASSIELSCQMPFQSSIDNTASLKEVSRAVQETFEEATQEIGGCQVIPVIASRSSKLPEMSPKTAEIARRKFQYRFHKRS